LRLNSARWCGVELPSLRVTFWSGNDKFCVIFWTLWECKFAGSRVACFCVIF
jgi:hypothetical protein